MSSSQQITVEAHKKDSTRDSATNTILATDQVNGVKAHKLAKLSPEDHAVVLHDIAGIVPRPDSIPSRSDLVVRLADIMTTSLYGNVIYSRRKTEYRYQALSTFHNTSLVIQLFLGAVLTALSGSNSRHQAAITILAAANTVNAGLLALLHNSGLPERIKNDYRELEKVEQHIKALVETGIVEGGWSKEEVVADCWDRYTKAKDVIGRNKSANYSASEAEKGVKGPETVV